MRENEFRDGVCALLRSKFPKISVNTGANLLYRLIVDSEGRLKPEDYRNPRRDELAFFQTDILISAQGVPLVVIETKYGGLNTDDVLAYSAKATRHKEVYPYLRYGLVVGGTDNIEKKFFVHNIGSVFDYALAVKSIDSGSTELVEIVRSQVRAAESLRRVDKMERIRKYSTTVELIG
jgi:hypothetical protein